jgi:hypothetical protein
MTTANIQTYAYFPALVYRDEHPEWVDYTKEVAQSYFDRAEQQGFVRQTEHMAFDPALKFLTDYLVDASVEILRQQGYLIERYDFYLSGLWGQEASLHGGTDIHVHKHSQVCGWLFLETPKDGAHPVYYDTRKNKEMVSLDTARSEELNNASQAVHFNSVKPGTVLFANSWMQHQMLPSRTEEKTVTIHFTVSHREKGCNTCNML